MISLVLLAALVASAAAQCSITQVGGTHAPAEGSYCAGDLIFEDNFDTFQLDVWEHEQTLAGGGNWEFQWYTNNRTNSYVEDGTLRIKPTLVADALGEDFLASGDLDIQGGAPADACTNPQYYGCERTGTASNYLNPVKSARVRSVNSFFFTYGRLEVRAKMPGGDWLWPAIWLLPRYNAYSSWPSSGEIDLVESRGNRDLVQNGANIGTHNVGSTLHWGPLWNNDPYYLTSWGRTSDFGYNDDFHTYVLEWTDSYIRFELDGTELGRVDPPAGGFWELGGLDSTGYENPWRLGTRMAPFDQKFYVLINVAVGGVNGYFPDDASNPQPKPWANSSPQASTDFWNGHNDWEQTWNLNVNNGYDASLVVDYVRVYAI